MGREPYRITRVTVGDSCEGNARDCQQSMTDTPEKNHKPSDQSHPPADITAALSASKAAKDTIVTVIEARNQSVRELVTNVAFIYSPPMDCRPQRFVCCTI
jgi:hypothetical protein